MKRGKDRDISRSNNLFVFLKSIAIYNHCSDYSSGSFDGVSKLPIKLKLYTVGN